MSPKPIGAVLTGCESQELKRLKAELSKDEHAALKGRLVAVPQAAGRSESRGARFDSFLTTLESRLEEIANYFLALSEQWLRRGTEQQDQGPQAPLLRDL